MANYPASLSTIINMLCELTHVARAAERLDIVNVIRPAFRYWDNMIRFKFFGLLTTQTYIAVFIAKVYKFFCGKFTARAAYFGFPIPVVLAEYFWVFGTPFLTNLRALFGIIFSPRFLVSGDFPSLVLAFILFFPLLGIAFTPFLYVFVFFLLVFPVVFCAVFLTLGSRPSGFGVFIGYFFSSVGVRFVPFYSAKNAALFTRATSGFSSISKFSYREIRNLFFNSARFTEFIGYTFFHHSTSSALVNHPYVQA